MRFKLWNVKIYVEYLIIFFVILVIAFNNLRSYFSNYVICFLFVAFHEFSHILVAALLGVECTNINIRLCGMNAVFKPRSRLSLKWLYILIAGPLSNILLAIAFNRVEFIRDINFALALVNLLPIYPLDGYGIFKMVLEFLVPRPFAEKVLSATKIFLLTALFLLGGFLIISIKNPAVLIFAIYIVTLRSAREVRNLKYVSRKLQKYYKILLNLLHFCSKFSII